MRANTVTNWVATVVIAVVSCATLGARVQDQPSLGSVRLPHAVVANGQPLPAGTYAVRLSPEAVTPVVGQNGSEHWVEFVQRGEVKGKELASVVKPADVKAVAKITPPSAGAARVQMLRGADYLRVWLNRSGTQYLVHLSLK